ncbi:cysteine--tRNA ligase [Sinorhizobium garamanticum]|uniref:Cysteine--tRNA ligase n=1 Tax=Sinorhizobium garamanticum TaxID=680247 RepID=A0ABY8D4F0_9HYPH|nr:cysteine--tRNA ligase [Sinorhizobium garamanticum]WEX85740.1 cysteine--tRNA ligase [Sinorhizobium garamanticum]
MSLILTNSLGGQKEPFVPQDPTHVRIYVCGPTVYNYAHIGNARPAVIFDVLARLLRDRFPAVTYARNFTDVDDKINDAARASGEPIGAITKRYIEAYHADMAALGVLPPSVEPRVTEHIPEIIDLIGRLIAEGHAYEAEGHVLYHVPSFPDYGALSRRTPDEMIAGARIEVAPFKKHPADFVLWKPSTPDLPGWDSSWGRGRPGWHIECSAMIERHLGPRIDIHGGGQDLIFPHHENEIAQGTRATYWLHNGFVTVDGRKMSKSLGNVFLVRDLLSQAPGEAIRYALLSAHYRQPLDWSARALQQARRSLDRLYTTLGDLGNLAHEGADPRPYLETFRAKLDNDLNTPAAIAELFRLARMAQCERSLRIRASLHAAMLAAGAMLGLIQQTPAEWFERNNSHNVDEAEVERLIAERNAARAKRDFVTADQLREQLRELGVVIEDRSDRAIWRKAPA